MLEQRYMLSASVGVRCDNENGIAYITIRIYRVKSKQGAVRRFGCPTSPLKTNNRT